MFEFFDFKNLFKQQVPASKQDRSNDIIQWQSVDSNANDFPQQLLTNTQNSPAGSAALDLWQEFTEGDGLLDDEQGEKQINPTQNVNDLTALLSTDLVHMWGFAFVLQYDGQGKVTSIHHLPFEETRLGLQEDNSNQVNRIYHNPYYGTKDFDKKLTRWYYDYTPTPESVVSQMESHRKQFTKEKGGETIVDPPYPGQVFWFSIEQPMARVYPKPFYFSTVNWLILDSEIQSFHEKNIKNNFLLSVLINMHGRPDDPAGPPSDNKDSTNKTEDQIETIGEVMTRQMKRFQDSSGGAFINWFMKDEEKATFEEFPTNSHHELFTVLQNLTSDQIAIGLKAPRILLGIGTAGKLGDTNEILNAWWLMDSRTRRLRRVIERVYQRVLGLEDAEIKSVKPPNIIPDLAWPSLSRNEQRDYIKRNFDVDLIEGEAPTEPEEKEELEIKTSDNGS